VLGESSVLFRLTAPIDLTGDNIRLPTIRVALANWWYPVNCERSPFRCGRIPSDEVWCCHLVAGFPFIVLSLGKMREGGMLPSSLGILQSGIEMRNLSSCRVFPQAAFVAFHSFPPPSLSFPLESVWKFSWGHPVDVPANEMLLLSGG